MDISQAGLRAPSAFSLGHEEGIRNQCDAGPVFGVLNPIGEGMKLGPTFGGGESCQKDGLEGQGPERGLG